MPQSTANPDFAFEVGKTYRTYDKKSSVTITKRSACYVSGVEENGETFRRKILKYAATYEYNGDGKVFECFILHEHVHVSARDEAQPDESATAEITNASDNDNAMASQPAEIANPQSEDTAQPEITATAEIAQTVKYAFIPGKVYAYRFSCSVDTYYCKITAKTDKTICYVKYNCDEITRAKLRSDNRGEYFYVGKSALVHADDLADAEIASRLFECTENTPNPHDNNMPAEIAQSEFISPYDYDINAISPNTAPITPSAVKNSALLEVSQPDALYMDDSFSDAPGDNSECARNQDFPVDFPECTPAEITQPDLSAPIDNNPLHHLKPCPACHSTHIPFLKRCDDNNFSTATRRFNGGIARQHIYYRLKCRDCGHEVKATIYRTGLGRFVIPHQNEADVKNEVCQAWNKQYDDNPGITIVPSDEIEKPDYTVYPEPIFDECPYVTVYACDKPENTPRRNPITEAKFKWVNQILLAVFFLCKFIIPVMAMRKNDIRRDKATPFMFSIGCKYPAQVSEFTHEQRKHNPAPASDIQHKLIETKDLHFAEKRKALDHNAAVISSCMFSEAVISLLSSISLQAILQLGFHMRLFIAKPKGKKNVVADLFAKRLIEYRELRANVRSTSDNITANNSASVPDGVNFFETKHRQLGFIFTE